MEQFSEIVQGLLGGGISAGTVALVAWGWVKQQSAKLDRIDNATANCANFIATYEPGIRAVIQQTEDMHDWHARTDEDGVKLMYSRNKGLETAINKLTEHLDAHNQMLIQVVHELKEIRKEQS